VHGVSDNKLASRETHVRCHIALLVKSVKANHLIENLKTFETEITQQEIELLDALDGNVHYCWDPAGIP
jgi:diketogulonate reductase-like aldo/keto reductase